jgi:hypothetical protein
MELERVTEGSSADLPAYAAERAALGEGGPVPAELDRPISPFGGHRQIRLRIDL